MKLDQRRVCVTMDYLNGVSVEALAKREGVVPQRIYQWINDVYRNTSMYKEQALANPIEFQLRVRRLVRVPSEAVVAPDTPEAFFHQLVREREAYER